MPRSLTARTSHDLGQTTVELALLIMAGAGFAFAAGKWALESGAVERLFDGVIEHVVGDI
jgi:hypothetical protein